MVGVIVADQAVKLLATHFLDPLHPVRVIPAFFWLTLCYNTGAAFSMFRRHPSALTILNTIVTVLIVIWGIRLPRKEKRLRAALGLIAGGASGNLIDRFFRGGHVVDFLDVHWFDKAHWPVFNLADTAICIGVGLIILDFLLHKKIKTEKQLPKKGGNKNKPCKY